MRHFIVAIVAATAVAAAQTPSPAPTFEVASIKPNKSGDGRIAIAFQPGGRFTATGVTLRMLIADAVRHAPTASDLSDHRRARLDELRSI